MVACPDPILALHEEICEAVRNHRNSEHRLAQLLATLEDEKGWLLFGHASLCEYARVRHQIEPRKARSLAQLGHALSDLPVLDAAMAEGTLPWTKARELLRVVVPETQQTWLERAQKCPSRDLGALVGAEASETICEEACCDAEVVDLRPGPEQGHLSRTVAPATRRAVVHRDRRTCRVPGCNNRLYGAVHHIVSRLRGGGHGTGNLVLLCTCHHRQLHEGRLAIEGDADGVLRIEHPDGRVAHVGRGGEVEEGRLGALERGPRSVYPPPE
ncbi:MAG TPA: HNH endonuclease signature motif containing protein [Myxococcota bacterium]|nr:HNH endonuclease signature motif containing protein [Myxococcota bacterium]